MPGEDRLAFFVIARFFLKYVSVLCACLLLLACSEQPEISVVEISGPIMGTHYSVKLAEPHALPKERLQGLSEGIKQRLASVDSLMSTYKVDSEVSRLSALAVEEAFRVHPDTFRVLTIANQVYRDSGGAFDPSVGPLVDLWGFGSRNKQIKQPPEEGALLNALQATGFQYLTLLPDTSEVRKLHPIEIDLSAIAKGYAVDQVAGYLRDQGVENFLVEVGGEIATSGLNARNTKWVLGIERPDFMGRSAYTSVHLSGEAMATSGDYRNYFESEGRRYSHTIDPRTGRPVQHRLASVSVIHSSCAFADAWATALLVLGEEQGPKLAESLGLKAFFIERSGTGFRTIQTKNFDQYLMK